MRAPHPTAIAVLVSIAIACGSARLPAPTYAPHPTEALQRVPYPPPPPRVEKVPPQSADGTVWIDGEWRWDVRRWTWQRGRWVKPPQNARFSPWTTVRDAQGSLYFAPGTWRGPNGEEIDEPGSTVDAGPEAPLPRDAGADDASNGEAPADAAAIELPDASS